MSVQPTVLGIPSRTEIEQFARRTGKELTRQAKPVQRELISIGRNWDANPNKIVNVPVKALIPAVIASNVLLYQEGLHLGSPFGWLTTLAEASSATWLINNTQGIYPLFGLALASYRVGGNRSRAGRLKAITETAITLGLGWLGVKVMTGINQLSDRKDLLALHHFIFENNSALAGLPADSRSVQVRDWIVGLPEEIMQNEESQPNIVKTTFARLVNHLNEWHQRKARMNPNFKPKELDIRLFMLEQDMFHALKTLRDNQDLIAVQLMTHTKEEHQDFIAALTQKVVDTHSPLKAFNRLFNPVFGYIVAGFFLSRPIINWVNRRIDNVAFQNEVKHSMDSVPTLPPHLQYTPQF
ncbi:MAG: hypothetical protein AAGI66_03920 [Cyanobacteria bacterium P01_H01_bin.74]